MRLLLSLLLAASLSLPAVIPLLARRRFILALGVWPFAATLGIALPLSMESLWGWPRSLWAAEVLFSSVMLGLLLEMAVRVAGLRESPAIKNRTPRTWGRWDSLSCAGALVFTGAGNATVFNRRFSKDGNRNGEVEALQGELHSRWEAVPAIPLQSRTGHIRRGSNISSKGCRGFHSIECSASKGRRADERPLEGLTHA